MQTVHNHIHIHAHALSGRRLILFDSRATLCCCCCCICICPRVQHQSQPSPPQRVSWDVCPSSTRLGKQTNKQTNWAGQTGRGRNIGSSIEDRPSSTRGMVGNRFCDKIHKIAQFMSVHIKANAAWDSYLRPTPIRGRIENGFCMISMMLWPVKQ